MASCLEIVNEECIEELKDKSENKNMKNNTEWWKNFFKKWADEGNLETNLEEYKNDALDQPLSQFQLSIQKFRNFALYAIAIALYAIALYAIYRCATSENKRDINPSFYLAPCDYLF